jgi:hypothetical protein
VLLVFFATACFAAEGDIIELRLQHHYCISNCVFDWEQADLSTIVANGPPASPAVGDPFPYVTPDGVYRIVYRGTDNHIHELRLQGVWQQADLSILSGDANPSAYGDAFAYVTPDGIPRYRGVEEYIHALRLHAGWPLVWVDDDLSMHSGAPPPPSPTQIAFPCRLRRARLYLSTVRFLRSRAASIRLICVPPTLTTIMFGRRSGRFSGAQGASSQSCCQY